jgi:SAM-dependent methyltransferase
MKIKIRTQKKYGQLHTLLHLWRGQSLLRIRMNQALSGYSVRGKTLDVGGGHSPDYFQYLNILPSMSLEMIDGSESPIDFERDSLPFEKDTFNTMLLCNVLEHIYNHQFLLEEVRRVLRPEGELIGFVPFWIGYHADPHDYFRYTHEALLRMLTDAGFVNVKIVPLTVGPILANFNTIVLSLPRILRPVVYVWYLLMNAVFVALRPDSGSRNPLGYIFSAN